ncbi:MAG: CapA family protein [Pseudobdellovibrio sp.]
MKLFILLQLVSSLVSAKSPLPDISFSKTKSASNTSIVISFNGDILIHDELYKSVMKDPAHDFSKIWKKTFPLFEKADFSYANLEGPTALGIDKFRKNKGDVGFKYDKIVYSGTDFLFNFHPKIIDDIKKSGIDIVSLANNHSYDRGSRGIDVTIDQMLKRDFPFIGVRKAASKEPVYTLTQIKNFNVAWIACTEALNGFKDKNYQLLFCNEQKEEIIALIKQLRTHDDIDFILITPHWGIEYDDTPSILQKNLARKFLEAGALAVVGSHPHVLQPVEKYITKDKRETFIAYSLGNFVAHQKNIERKASATIYLEFTKTLNSDHTNNSKPIVTITHYNYEPTTRYKTEVFPANHLPEVIKHVEKYLGKFSSQ